MNRPFYYVIMSKGLEPDVAFYLAVLHEDAYENTAKISTKMGFEIVEVPKEKNPHREAEIWVEEDKDSPFYKSQKLAGCIELKGTQLTAARRKRPDLKGLKGVRAYLFFGRG
jgi:hypothetical protein